MRKSVLLLISLLVFSSAFKLLASGQIENTTHSKAEKPIYAIVYPNRSPFFEPISKGAVSIANQQNCSLIIQAPKGNIDNEQIHIVEKLIERKVQGIAVFPSNPQLITPIIDLAETKHIPVICFIEDAPLSERRLFISIDREGIGEHLLRVLNNTQSYGNIILLALEYSDSMFINSNLSEFLIENSQNLLFKSVEFTEEDRTKDSILYKMELAIEQNPDFSLLIVDQVTCAEALLIWKAKAGKKPIIAVGESIEIFQGIRDGFITQSITEQFFVLGQEIILNLIERPDGFKIQNDENVPYRLLDKSNLDQYLKRIDMLEFEN